jgi:hypothetical protein
MSVRPRGGAKARGRDMGSGGMDSRRLPLKSLSAAYYFGGMVGRTRKITLAEI